jgi:hypothetical protein
MKLRGFEVLPWVLTFAAVALFLLAAAARAETIVAAGDHPLTDRCAPQNAKFIMKAGRPVDRNSL